MAPPTLNMWKKSDILIPQYLKKKKVTKAPPALKMLNHLDIDMNIWRKMFEGLKKSDVDSPIFDEKSVYQKK